MLSNEETLLVGLLPLLSYALVTCITPGPNNLMLLASGINFGLRPTVPHMLGICAGSFIMIVLSGLGGSLIFQRYDVLHDILKYAGCAYMLYLAWKIANAVPLTVEHNKQDPLSFWQAACFQYVNPKAWVMATPAVSLFMPQNAHAWTESLRIAIVFSVVFLPCLVCWAVFGTALSKMLNDSLTRKIFNGGIGAVTAATAIWLLFE